MGGTGHASLSGMGALAVTLLTLGDPDQPSGGYLFHRRLADLASEHGARITFSSLPPWRFPLPMLAAPAVLRRARAARPDALVVDSIAAAFVAPWLATLRVPTLAMLHQPPGGIGHGAVRAQLQRALDTLAYRRMRLLLVASRSLADELRDELCVRIPIQIIEPGRDPASSALPASDLRQGRRAAILCVASWLPNKGIAELLEAVAALPDELATLHLVGETAVDPGYAATLRARLEQPDLRGRVVIHGQLAPGQVAGLYAAADLFALPSYRETYGTAWGEAMNAGLPIVGWRAGNLPYLADHEREALLVAPGDVAGLSAALRRLVEDEPMRRRLGASALARASVRPTWDETAAAFFAAIRSVTASGRPS
jgi:glycosyltransferase involved in cell wall biosynthesis